MADSTTMKRRSSGRPKVLLVDEADVLFHPKFYSMPYTSLSFVRSPEVDALVRFVWSLKSTVDAIEGRAAAALFEQVMDSEEFKTCLAKYSSWWYVLEGQEVVLLEEVAKTLVTDLLTFESHEYHVLDGKIQYSDGSGQMAQNRNVGYKTMFAYFKANRNGDVSNEELDKHIGLLMRCGMFSYAEMPRLYDAMLGVTGTLQTLSDEERELLTGRYNVNKFTYIPSVYGPSKVQFRSNNPSDVRICREGHWYSTLVNDIGLRLQGQRPDSSPRAVMVFFNTMKDLNEFRESEECRSAGCFVANNLHIFTEATAPHLRDAAVLRAVSSGTVTLLTKEIGRGTNFKCDDKELNANGGEW